MLPGYLCRPLKSLYESGLNCHPEERSDENGSVVQLVRMPPCHGGGRGFESRPDRKTRRKVLGFQALFSFPATCFLFSLGKRNSTEPDRDAFASVGASVGVIMLLQLVSFK